MKYACGNEVGAEAREPRRSFTSTESCDGASQGLDACGNPAAGVRRRPLHARGALGTPWCQLPTRGDTVLRAERCPVQPHGTLARQALRFAHFTEEQAWASDPVRWPSLCPAEILSLPLPPRPSLAPPDQPGTGGGGHHIRAHPVGGSRSRGQAPRRWGRRGVRRATVVWTTGPAPAAQGGAGLGEVAELRLGPGLATDLL